VDLARHPRCVSLEEGPGGGLVQITPPMLTRALIVTRRQPSATAAEPPASAPTSQPHRDDHDQFAVLQPFTFDPFDHHPVSRPKQPLP
jgi:hypothetical protein